MENERFSQVRYESLMDAAKIGDINVLYSILGQDPFILEKFDQIPFTVTPLHTAVETGQTKFAMEVLRLKPSFVRKLNPDGFSPIHMASTNGNVIMVRKFMGVDSDLGLFKGREGRSPLHCATIAGKVDVIDELISTCPESVEGLTVSDESVIHLAVKNGQLEAFKVLMGWLKWLGKMDVLSWKEEEGNTILHMAASTNKHEVVQMLVRNSNIVKQMDMNAKNKNGLTALDVLKQLPRETDTRDIEVMLCRSGAIRGHGITSPLPLINSHTQCHRVPKKETISCLGRCMKFVVFRIPRKIALDVRNALLVVAVLIATATYQVGLNPPSQSGSINSIDGEGHPYGYSYGNTSLGVVSLVVFMLMNSLGFYTSLFMIAILTLGLPLYRLVVILLFSMMCTYIWSIELYAIRTYGFSFRSSFGQPRTSLFIFFALIVLSILFLIVTLILGKFIKKIN